MFSSPLSYLNLTLLGEGRVITLYIQGDQEPKEPARKMHMLGFDFSSPVFLFDLEDNASLQVLNRKM